MKDPNFESIDTEAIYITKFYLKSDGHVAEEAPGKLRATRDGYYLVPIESEKYSTNFYYDLYLDYLIRVGRMKVIPAAAAENSPINQ